MTHQCSMLGLHSLWHWVTSGTKLAAGLETCGSPLCSHTKLPMNGQACTAAHDNAIHEGDVGLGQGADEAIQRILAAEEPAHAIGLQAVHPAGF